MLQYATVTLKRKFFSNNSRYLTLNPLHSLFVMISPILFTDSVLIFSFMNLLLTKEMPTYYQPRTIKIYTDLQTISKDYIASMASQASPIHLIDLNQKQPQYYQTAQDSDNLNIMVFSEKSSASKIENIQSNIDGDEQSIIIIEFNITLKMLNSMISEHLKFLNSFIVLCCQNTLYSIRVQKNMQIRKHSLESGNYSGVLKLVKRLFTKDILNVYRSNITTFLKYIPPMSTITPIDVELKELVLNGIDSLVTYDLIGKLNGTAVMNTDVAQEDSKFREWFTVDTPYIKNLQNRLYHMDAIRNVSVDDFNYT